MQTRAWGFAAAVLAVWAAIGCGGGIPVTPTETGNCTKLAGAYVSSYGNSCGKYSSGDVVNVVQDGCTVTAEVNGVGTLTGKISGDAIDWKVDFGNACKGKGSGVGKIEGSRITSTYMGSQSGASCCALVSGTFTLTPK